MALLMLAAPFAMVAESFPYAVRESGTNLADILCFEPIEGTDGECRLVKKPSSAEYPYPYGYYHPDLTIPETVTDKTGKRYTVTEIGFEAFLGNRNIRSVTLPYSLTLVDVKAFYNCTTLSNVIVMPSVKEISSNAFYGCTRLQEVAIPVGSQLTSIGGSAFELCSNLKSFTVPEKVTYIGSNAFHHSGLEKLKFNAIKCNMAGTRYEPPLKGLEGVEVTFGEGVKLIPDNFFAEVSGMTSMAIPDGITEIGEAAFLKCPDLESVTIPTSVKKIGSSAFEECVSLTECDLSSVPGNGTVEDPTTGIGIKLFKGCTSLRSARLYAGMASIPEETFMGCESLVDFVFPANVRMVGKRAFYGCSALPLDNTHDDVWPKNLATIDDEAFRGCTLLTKFPAVSVRYGEYALASTGIVSAQLTSGTLDKGVFADCTSLRSVSRISGTGLDEIPESLFDGCSALENHRLSLNLTEIGRNAYRNCSSLTGVDIPNLCTTIGEGAFEGCTGIRSVNIKPTLEQIGISAFKGCSALTEITVPDRVKNIYAQTFAGCSSLTSVKLGYSVNSISYDAFSGCTSITDVTATTPNPPTVSDTFMPSEVYEQAELHVPAGQRAAYSAATGWKNFKSSQELDPVKVRNLLFDPDVSLLGVDIMHNGRSATIKVTVLPDNATDRTLQWFVSDEETVKLTTSGTNRLTATLRGLKPGSVKVSVKALGADASFPMRIFDVTVHPNPVTDIRITPRGITMTEESSRQLTAIVTPAAATDPSVEWTSSDESVVKVNSGGLLNALKPGQAVITATAKDGSGVEARCTVNVVERIIEVSAITLDATKLSLTEGDTHTLTASVSPDDATDRSVEWTSSDETVATVSPDGEVKAISAGEATITATANDGSETQASCTVRVVRRIIPPTGVTLDATELKLTEGDTRTLTATVGPEDATDKSVTWSSSDNAIAAVSADGVLTALAPGEATVSATANGADGIIATCRVKVSRLIIPVSEVTLTADATECTVGDDLRLSLAFGPDNATDPQVAWSVSDPTLVEMTEPGVFRLLAPGEVTITVTVTTPDGVKKSASVVIKTSPRVYLVESIDLPDDELELIVGATLQLIATVGPEHADNRDLLWATSNPSVLTVSSSGLLTAVGEGEATVTATAADGSGIMATCAVRVTSSPGTPDNPDDPGVSGIYAIGADSSARIRVVDLGGRTVFAGSIAELHSATLPHGYYIVLTGDRTLKIRL